MDPADLLGAMKRTVEQLAAFNEIAKALTSTLELREVLALAMQKVSELLHPSHWSLLLHDERTGKLSFEIAVGEGASALKPVTLEPGEGIAGAVFSSGVPRLVTDVTSDPAFSRRFDARTQFQTGSIVAVPLKSRGKVLGVIELVKSRGDAPFNQHDLTALSGMADYLAIAIDNARNFERVQELTITDEHTGLYNARHLRALLDQEVFRAGRFSHPLSVVFLDLDHFKDVNDTHGHLVGSALLRGVGQLLTGVVRQVDPVFRYGGDEFAVVLIETGAAEAHRVAERIRDGFRQAEFTAGPGLALRLTASVGMACFPEDAQSGTELLQAADRAMYRVKASGRDGVATAAGAMFR